MSFSTLSRLPALALVAVAACFYSPTGVAPTGEGTGSTDDPTSTTGPTSTGAGPTEDPAECDEDGACEPGEDLENCPADCPAPACGDGELDPGELCDDGPDNGSYGACALDCAGQLVCGDGHVDGPEVCDDGPVNSDEYAATEHCDADCSGPAPHCGDDVCTADVEDANVCADDCAPQCGNAAVEPGEDCDPGTAEDDADCDADCSAISCGDTHVNAIAGEACDDGNRVDTDECVACQLAACGDGHVQAGVEQCDDANAEDLDACSTGCVLPRQMFVTSIKYTGDLDGIAGADSKCQFFAIQVGLEGTYRAWLSDNTLSPGTRFDTTFTGAYKRVDGVPIALGWAGLTGSELLAPPNRDEQGKLQVGDVWTNTLMGGMSASNSHCASWNSTVGTSSVGKPESTLPIWSYDLGGVACNTLQRLYCFENP